jgi:hypothetical protein
VSTVSATSSLLRFGMAVRPFPSGNTVASALPQQSDEIVMTVPSVSYRKSLVPDPEKTERLLVQFPPGTSTTAFLVSNKRASNRKPGFLCNLFIGGNRPFTSPYFKGDKTMLKRVTQAYERALSENAKTPNRATADMLWQAAFALDEVHRILVHKSDYVLENYPKLLRKV